MLTVTLGPLTMALNHLLMLTALVIASVVGWWVARRGGESPESALFNLFLIGLLSARLGFVLAERASLTNVGGEGQIAVGGIARTR